MQLLAKNHDIPYVSRRDTTYHGDITFISRRDTYITVMSHLCHAVIQHIEGMPHLYHAVISVDGHPICVTRGSHKDIPQVMCHAVIPLGYRMEIAR